MGRPPRIAIGGIAYHVLNRANGRAKIFASDGDYRSFQDTLGEAAERNRMRVLAHCIMPTHWHLVLWPRENGDLSRMCAWLSLTHMQRWHAAHGTAGQGHVYQGRFKSFPVEQDEHLLTVIRYVESNALRAGLVRKAESWRWSSLWVRSNDHELAAKLLHEWPTPRPRHWLRLVNEPIPPNLAKTVQTAIARGQPFGREAWVRRTAAQLGLQSTMRDRGRPGSALEKVSDTGV